MNTAIVPSADNLTVTAFDVGACPATQFKLDANGRGASAGNTVKKLAAVGEMIAMFNDTAVADEGIAHRPFKPHTATTYVSFSPTGDDRWPTLSDPERVSTNRHGTIATNDDGPTDPADPVNTPPAPTTTTTTPITLAHRRRPLTPDSTDTGCPLVLLLDPADQGSRPLL